MTTTESLAVVPESGQLSHEQILQTTLRCLREEGYDATTIRRIARRLGCAVGSIYRYFKDKRELLLAVTQRLIEPVTDALADGATFEQSVDRYIESAGADCQPYRLMFWLTCDGGPPQMPPVVQKIVDRWSRQLDDAALAQRCWAMLHGSLIAGLDPQVIRLSVLATAGAPGGGHGDAMAQMVTILKSPAPAAPPTPAAGGPDDVTLL